MVCCSLKKNHVIAFLGISGQDLGSWGVYTRPGGPWDHFPPSGAPNGGRGMFNKPSLIINKGVYP